MASSFDLRHLRYFVAVADERNFSRAAAKLGIAQPPVSQQIHDLERVLGVQLFDRRRRQIELTSAGKILLEHAREVLALVDSAVDATRRAQRDDQDTMSVGFFGSMSNGREILPLALRRFAEIKPSVYVILHELRTDDLLIALREGVVDVGLSLIPQKVDPQFVISPLFRDPLVAVLPADHERAGTAQVLLKSLQHMPFVLFAPHLSSQPFRLVMELCEAAGFQPEVIHKVEQLPTMGSFIAGGIGISVLPRSTALALHNVVLVPIADEGAFVDRCAVRYVDNPSASAAIFIDILKSVVADTVAV